MADKNDLSVGQRRDRCAPRRRTARMVPAPCDLLLSMAAIVEESYRASNPASPETIGRWSGRRGIARLGGHACRALPAFAWNNHESRLMFDWINSGKAPEPRKGMPSPRLGEGEFKRQFRAQFQDQAFTPLAQELEKIAHAAWDAYEHSRKSPHTRKAGPEFADPDYELSLDWIAAREAVKSAQQRHEDSRRAGAYPPHQLLVPLGAYLPERDVEELQAGRGRARGARRCRRCGGRVSRSLAPRFGVRPQHPM